MNKFWLRHYNSLGCEIDAVLVAVPEGKDYAPVLCEAIQQLVEGAPIEPGDTIKVDVSE